MAAPGNAQIKPDYTQTGESPKVRTLHEPPDIWELVHETRVEFKPGSAFVGRLKALHPLAIALILLIIGGGAVFGFMKLRALPENHPENHIATPAQTESSKPKIVLSPQSTESNRTVTVSDKPSNSAPASVEPETRKIEEPKTAIAVPVAPPVSEAPARPRRDPPTAITAKGATVAAARPRDKARSATVTKAGSTIVTRTDNKNGRQGSTAFAPKSDKEKNTDSPAAKKAADKTLSPQLITPARTSPTPKAKVIDWP